MIENGDLDSALVTDSVTKKSLMGVAIMAGEITLNAGDITVEENVTVLGGTINVEPGVAPLHAIIDSGHVIIDSGDIEATIPSRDTDLPLGLVKVESGTVSVEPGTLPIHSIIDSGAITATIPSRAITTPLGLVKVDSGNIIVDSVTAQIKAKLDTQASSSGDGVLITDYAQDYMVRGKAFQIQRRITLTANQTLSWVVDFSTAIGKTIFVLPVVSRSGGGLVFIDTFYANSYTGGSVETPNKLNGNSATSALSVVKSGITPTGVNDLREYTVGTSKTNQSSGGGNGGAEVPKILTNYPRVFRFINQESSAVTIDFGFVWYELDAA